jgi:hypothetical protein
MSPSARSWFAILSGMILGIVLVAAVWMFSGGPEAGSFSVQPRGGIISPSVGQGH